SFGELVYQLSERDMVIFECDLRECVEYWSNVRTDQWSGYGQFMVANWLQHATSVNGWREPRPQPPQSPDNSRPASPVDSVVDQYMDYEGAVQPHPDGGNDNDDASSTSTQVEPEYDDDDISDGGFSSIISDILNHEDEYIITQPGQGEFRRDDDGELEWRPSSPTPVQTTAVGDDRQYNYFDWIEELPPMLNQVTNKNTVGYETMASTKEETAAAFTSSLDAMEKF
ncbi:1453_t:CDS:2, partial [Paraglomus occultum]